MRVLWSRFEILTGTGATFLAIAFVCVFLEAARIETGVALRAAQALEGSGLAWLAVEPHGRALLLSGGAPDQASADEALRRVAALAGVRQVASQIGPIGSTGATCQALLDAAQAPQAVTFKVGQAELAETSHDVLSVIARQIVECGVRIEVAVHGEARGSAAVSLALSQRRADLVARRLVDTGVATHALVANGYGATQPIAQPGETGSRGANQRVEIRILGVDS